jgi:4-amino-4-deoxy-L-arabinose transferase-like glycosyltransferase
LTKIKEKGKIEAMKKTLPLILLFLTNTAHAVQINPPTPSGLDLAGLIENIWTWLYWISFPIAVLVIIVAGFMFVTASGNENQIKKAKNLLLYAAIGFLVIILSQGIVNLIKEDLAP